MAVPFQIPNIEQFLPTGANVGAASLPQAPGPTASAPLSYLDPKQSQDFLETIQFAKAPEPQKLKTWQKIVGALGDAIQAMAAVRAGGQAPALGPFATRNLQTQQQNRQEAMSAEEYNRDIKNRISIMREEERLRREREMGVAGMRSSRFMRPQLRLVQTTDSKGNPVTVPMVFDPETETLSPMETTVGQGSFPRFVPPQTLASPQGFQQLNKLTGQATPVQGEGGGPVFPQPPAGVVQSVAASTAAIEGLEDLWQAYNEVREATAGEGGIQDAIRQRVGTAVGETRMGGAFAPEYAKYTAARRASLNAYIKQQTGAQFSVKELTRYDTQYPEPWDPPDLALTKIQALRERALSDMQAKIRAFPGAAGAAPQKRGPSIRRSQLRQLSPEDSAATEADARRRGVAIIED